MLKSTMPRFRTSRLAPLVVALALSAAFVLAGCDSNDDEDDSDFAVFAAGSWEVTELRIEGTDLTSQLDARYESNIVFSFTENDNTNERGFSIFGRVDGEANLDAGGEVDIDGDDDVLFFQPVTGARAFELEYEIDSNSRIFLVADDRSNDGSIMRDLLLPNSTLGGSRPGVEVIIERQFSP